MASPNDNYSSYSDQGAFYGENESNKDGGGAVLRRRNVDASSPQLNANGRKHQAFSPAPSVVKKFDFMFPKVDTEYTVKTDRGGVASVVAYCLIALLVLAETGTWIGQNRAVTEHISVDTTLGLRMRVNINITFPALACDDLHLDVMDVAGDAQ
jgi:hypothetical protein